MNQSFWIGIAAATAAVVSWGIQLPIAKDAFDVVNPYFLTAIRYLGAALVLTALLIYREGLSSLSYEGKVRSLSFFGVIGMCLSPTLVFIGMSMSAAEHAVIIVALQPSITAITLWVLGKQRPSAFTITCIAVALFGVVLVVTKGKLSFDGSKQTLIGDLIVFAGAVAWVIYSLGVNRFTTLSTWRLTVLTMIPGTIATVIITAVMVQFGDINVPSVEDYKSVALELAYLTFIGVIAAMLAWNYGLRKVGAQNATLLINLMPVTAFTYRSLQGVKFEPIELFGVALVVGALIANNLMQRRQQLANARINTVATNSIEN
jgi:drug/metabolite transporter (DMT)-like permease